MIWVGLALHKRYITACALDDAGAVVAEHRRLPTEAKSLVVWVPSPELRAHRKLLRRCPAHRLRHPLRLGLEQPESG